VSLLNQEGSTSASQAASNTPLLPGAAPRAQPTGGNEAAPFLVASFPASSPGLTQSTLAIALAREEVATAAQFAAAGPAASTASFAGEAGLGLVLGDALPAVGGGVAGTAVRAASYNSQEDGEDGAAEELLPDEATEAGLMGLLPADSSALDQTLQQLLEQLNNLGNGLDQALPGGLAFWLLAGAVGVTACVTVRRRQATGVILAGEALAWIPSLMGFLPPAGDE
jgi:hypothetical protein